MAINVLTFIVIGLVAGLAVSFLFSKSKKLFWGTIFAGITGSLTGGILYSAFSIGKLGFEISPASLVIFFLGTAFFIGLLSIVNRKVEDS